jgi:beta-glucosidase
MPRWLSPHETLSAVYPESELPLIYYTRFANLFHLSITALTALGLPALLSTAAIAQSDSLATAPEVAEGPPSGQIDADLQDRIRALIQVMTLGEKIGQLQQLNGASGDVTGTADNLAAKNSLDEQIRAGRLGSILNEVNPMTINRLQKLAVDESRLGIPLIFGRDVIHGFRTVFPIPLGQAASWNSELVEKAAAVAAREARSVGIHWTFAPMLDIARDPRWGRIAESLGEDPYLASVLSAAMVRGFQGDDISSPHRVAACAKHFAGYGAGEGGRDYNSAEISPSLMRNVYLPPFQAAVDAGVATVMTSFNDINGVPCSANAHLLRSILRKEWNFCGFVVSDWTSVEEMIAHGYSRDESAAALAAINAGVNMEMVSRTYHDHLADLVERGEIHESLIDELVAEVLRVKFRLGLFDDPYADASRPEALAEEHLHAARQLAGESIVLLKNDNRLLPLDKSKIKKLAVIGPLADAGRAQLGAWVLDGRESDSRTPLAALRESTGDGIELIYAPGLADDEDRKRTQFDEAASAARKADAVLLIVGEGADLSGEARSRAILDLPGAQNELIEAIVATEKPVILIVQAGRPLTIGRQIKDVDAVLYSFHAGTMAGAAISDLVWGIEAPSGRLPVTFPKAVGQIPLYYNHTNTGRPPRAYDFTRDNIVDDTIYRDLGFNSNYIDISPYPLFPFGYGLTYTTFDYGPVELSTAKLRVGQVLAIRAPVTNTGDRAATDVVQLYVRDVVGSLVRPVRELKGFRRVYLAPGETQIVEFALATDVLAFFNNEEQRMLEPGKFELYIGGSSLAPLAGQFELVD